MLIIIYFTHNNNSTRLVFNNCLYTVPDLGHLAPKENKNRALLKKLTTIKKKSLHYQKIAEFIYLYTRGAPYISGARGKNSHLLPLDPALSIVPYI